MPPVIVSFGADYDRVGYGQCNGQLPSVLTVKAQVSAGLPPSNVTLRYRYTSFNLRLAPGPYHRALMAPSNGDTYVATIDVGTEAGTDLHGTSGNLEYHILAGDSLGRTASSAITKVQVQHC
jgi:hypothetical protein